MKIIEYKNCIRLLLACCTVLSGLSSCKGQISCGNTGVVKYFVFSDDAEEKYVYYVEKAGYTTENVFVFSKHKGHVDVMADGMVRYEPTYEPASIDEDTVAAVVVHNAPKRKEPRKVISYKEYLEELRLCMEQASENCEIDSLRYIRCCLDDFCDIGVEVTNKIIMGKGEITSRKEIDSLIAATSLQGDLNATLAPFHLHVESINSDDDIFDISSKYFRKINHISPHLKIPEFILVIPITITVSMDNADGQD